MLTVSERGFGKRTSAYEYRITNRGGSGIVSIATSKRNGEVVAESGNSKESLQDPLGHAEINVIRRAAARLGRWRLSDCSLYVTLEPCAMCAQALSWLRVKEIRFGAYDPKSGGVENGARVFTHAHHKPVVIGGVMEMECADIVKAFFAQKR